MTDDLVAFIRARIAEERADAEAATGNRWQWEEPTKLTSEDGAVLDDNYEDGLLTVRPEDAAHIARQDPAATLARCDADSREVDLCAEAREVDDYCVAEQLLRIKGSRWRDHADYQERWRA